MHAYTIVSTGDSDHQVQSQVLKGIEVSLRTGFVIIKETGTKIPVRPPLPPIVQRDGQDYLEEGLGLCVELENGESRYVLTANGTRDCAFHLGLWIVRGGISSEFIRSRPQVRVLSESYVASRRMMLAIFARGQSVRAKINIDSRRAEFLCLSCCGTSGKFEVENDGTVIFGVAKEAAPISAPT